jgi:hypothetical protein
MSDDFNYEIRRPAAVLNGRLRPIDQMIMVSGLTPKEQVAVAILAVVLAVRRLLAAADKAGQSYNRPSRRALVRSLIKDFELKLATYAMPIEDAGEEPQG